MTTPSTDTGSNYQDGFTEATVRYLTEALARIEKKLDDLPCSEHGERLARFDEKICNFDDKICNMDENKLSWKEIVYVIAAPILVGVLTTYLIGKI